LADPLACITFDDGHADNFHIALPILQGHGLPATFFIATGFLDGGACGMTP
jgi:peptidoglycan/xylan/chitin deacetylase (PgdA/CDA1 family)